MKEYSTSHCRVIQGATSPITEAPGSTKMKARAKQKAATWLRAPLQVAVCWYLSDDYLPCSPWVLYHEPQRSVWGSCPPTSHYSFVSHCSGPSQASFLSLSFVSSVVASGLSYYLVPRCTCFRVVALHMKTFCSPFVLSTGFIFSSNVLMVCSRFPYSLCSLSGGKLINHAVCASSPSASVFLSSISCWLLLFHFNARMTIAVHNPYTNKTLSTRVLMSFPLY